MKSEAEIREKLDELLASDYTAEEVRHLVGGKIGACKALLWTLGENDDDRWHITAAAGPPVDKRAMARN